MKKTIFTLILALAGCCFSFISCDQCKNVDCQNGATCDKGKCTCASGYEGEMCQTAIRDKMIGTYTGLLKCNGEDDLSYSIVISRYQPNAGKITMSEDGRLEFQCDIKSTNTFSFNTIISGTLFYYDGTVDGNKITIIETKKNSDLVVLETCTYTGTRQ